MRNLDDLLAWLEYGRTSGYIAAREPKEQEEYWADLLRREMQIKTDLLAASQAILLDVDGYLRRGGKLTDKESHHVTLLRAAVAKANGEG